VDTHVKHVFLGENDNHPVRWTNGVLQQGSRARVDESYCKPVSICCTSNAAKHVVLFAKQL